MRLIVVFSTALMLLVPSLSAQTKEEVVTKIEDRFEVSVAFASYSERTPGRLEIRCDVGVLDPNLILGISEDGVITRVKNNKDEIVDIANPKVPLRSKYEPLQYRGGFFIPPRTIKREPQWPDVFAPTEMVLELDSGLIGTDPDMINRIEGYFYVLMAESIEHVELPFEPLNLWVRLTPDLEIRLVEAEQYRRFRYNIETKGDTRGSYRTEMDLSGRLVVGRQWIGKNGRIVRRGRVNSRISPWVMIGGRGSGGTGDPVEKLRYVIAVKPSHHKIPFVLENISLPKRELK